MTRRLSTTDVRGGGGGGGDAGSGVGRRGQMAWRREHRRAAPAAINGTNF